MVIDIHCTVCVFLAACTTATSSRIDVNMIASELTKDRSYDLDNVNELIAFSESTRDASLKLERPNLTAVQGLLLPTTPVQPINRHRQTTSGLDSRASMNRPNDLKPVIMRPSLVQPGGRFNGHRQAMSGWGPRASLNGPTVPKHFNPIKMRPVAMQPLSAIHDVFEYMPVLDDSSDDWPSAAPSHGCTRTDETGVAPGDAVDDIPPPDFEEGYWESDRFGQFAVYSPYQGGFQIGKVLGRGGFGKVFEMTEVATGVKYALKVLAEKSMVPECASEVQLQKSVQPNPHAVKIVMDWTDGDGYELLMMELLADGTLQDKIGPNGLEDKYKPQAIFRQLAEGVQLLHMAGVVHRDLKPANIVCDESTTPPIVKIADFGCAARFTHFTLEDLAQNSRSALDSFGRTLFNGGENPSLKAMACTLRFASPESVGYAGPYAYVRALSGGVPYVGPEADVWSLGVMLYMSLSGQLPFPSKNRAEAVTMITTKDYPVLPDHVSDRAKDLVQGMLQKDPARRYTIEQVLAHPYLNEAEP